MSLIPPTGGAPISVSFDFPFQSFFSSTLYEQGLVIQSSQIVNSQAQQTGGWAVQVHPASQVPIAFDFQLADSALGAKAPGSVLVAKPGQVIRPGRFSSFNWGLPFGWLGGGVGTILVAQNKETELGAPANAEVLFHRIRLKIISDTTNPVTLKNNWPIRFPWPNATSGQTNGSGQGSSPIIGLVNPTKVLARLRVASLNANAVMRMIFFNADDFDRDSTYAVIASGSYGGACSVDINWPAFTASAITVTGGAGQVDYPFQDLDLIANTPLARLGGDNCAVILTDVTPGGGNPLANVEVDFCRYGVV